MKNTTENFPTYEARVRHFASPVYNLNGGVHFGVDFHHHFLLHDEKFWASRLISTTTPKLKALLEKDRPPTWAELGTLDPAVGSSELGTYFVCVDSPAGHHSHGYNGSATGLDGGMNRRVSEHLNPAFRKRLRDNGKSTFLYNLIDQPDVDRSARIFMTGAFPGLEDGTPASIAEMRVTCKLHEVMLMSFLRTFLSSKPGLTRDVLTKFGPWPDADVEWLPTNGSVPLMEQFKVPDSTVIVDPELRIDHRRALDRAKMEAWTDEQKEKKYNLQLGWREQIAKPIIRMRSSGVPEPALKDWRAVALKRRNEWLKQDETSRPPLPNLPPILDPPVVTESPRKRRKTGQE